MPIRRTRARFALPITILVATLLLSGTSVVTATTEPSPDTRPTREQRIERVIRIAKRQIGDPWVWARRGPNAFDCTGLVYFAFKKAGALHLIGGRWRGVSALRGWAERRDLTSRRHAKRGDLIVWGPSMHVGIYLGNGRAISALVRGVRIHRVHELTDPFTTYLHLRRYQG